LLAHQSTPVILARGWASPSTPCGRTSSRHRGPCCGIDDHLTDLLRTYTRLVPSVHPRRAGRQVHQPPDSSAWTVHAAIASRGAPCISSSTHPSIYCSCANIGTMKITRNSLVHIEMPSSIARRGADHPV
jgi:hypothetical protein